MKTTQRLVVVALIQNQAGQYLLCRMPPNRGVFPGQWGLPGGGVEDGETIEMALRREINEELGLAVVEVTPLFFVDGTYDKRLSDGRKEEQYLVFLLFSCLAGDGPIRLSPEFDCATWVGADGLRGLDLNIATRNTCRRLGLLD